MKTWRSGEIAASRAQGRPVESVRTEKALGEPRRIALRATADGAPIYLSDVAVVRLGPDIRRGVAEWNGGGEAVGGIVVMRFAVPMIGGLVTSFALELLIYPVLFYVAKRATLGRSHRASDEGRVAAA